MRQIGVRISDEMAEAIREARGDVPLNTWCVRAFEDKLLDPAGVLGLGARREEGSSQVAGQGAGDARGPAAERGSAGDSSPPAPRAREVTPDFKGKR